VRRSAVFLACALAVLAAAPASASPRDPRLRGVRTWAFAGGTRHSVDRLAAFDLVVVDGEDTPRREVRRLRARGTIVLAYLSVGTIEPGRSWYRRARRYRLDRWEDFGEWYADVSARGFRRLIGRRVAPALLRKGFDGLFLDNTDMVESHPRRRAGMRSLARSLSRLSHRRGRLIFTQNGERSIGPTLRLYDGWNREDVTSTYDFDRRRYVRVPRDDARAAQRALRRIARAGLLTTATDYVRRGDRRGAEAATTAACSAGALPFVTDIGLRRLPRPPLACPR
jgi:polysaccharide biosynthesis protein PelA